MAMNDHLQIANSLKTWKIQEVEHDLKYEMDVDSFDFGDRFEMDFDAGF